MNKLYITGLFGDIKEHKILLNDFLVGFKNDPFPIVEKYRCELPFWNKAKSKGIRMPGENYFIGYKSHGVIESDFFVTLEIPASEWAMFEVVPSKWYKSGDKAVEGWIKHNDLYDWQKFEGSKYQLEVYGEKYSGPDSVLEIWYQIEPKKHT